MIESLTLQAKESSNWSEDDACRCVVSPNFNSSLGLYRLLTMSVDFQYSSSSDGDIPQCLPMLLVSAKHRLDADPNNPLGISYNVCPGIDDYKRYTATPMMYKGQELVLHLYNTGRARIITEITIDEFDGTMSVQCSQFERITYEEGGCPCTSTAHYSMIDNIGASRFDEMRRLTIGLVTAFVFVLIIVAIIVGCIFYKKRQAKKAQGKMEAVTVENKAYEGSKQSVASDSKHQPPQKEPIVSFTPDPSLNLKLQQPAHHGSKDSGLASSNDNNDKDKRLPFMQPPPATHSLEDINQMPANYPPLAGQGSQSSLDHIDPVYTTRAGVPRQVGGKDLEKEGPPNYPPLAGHGSQSSLDKPTPYPGDIDALYAKPMKRRTQQEMKSGSYDKLNFDASPPAKEEQFHSAESLNVHTEV